VTDTDVFALVSSVVWIVGLVLGYGIGYLGGSTRTRQRVQSERVGLEMVRLDRGGLSNWRRARPLIDPRPGRVVAPRTVAPPRAVSARTIPRARQAPPR
jgi:hypothetical protein